VGAAGVGHVKHLRPRLACRQPASELRKQFAGIKITTDKKTGEKRIDQKQKWISLSSSFFRPFSFLFRLGSQRKASQDSAKAAINRRTPRASGDDLCETKMLEKCRFVLFVVLRVSPNS
jgi:hypothetical protein